MKANYLACHNDDIAIIEFKEMPITDKDLHRETFLSYLTMMPECTKFVLFSGDNNETPRN